MQSNTIAAIATPPAAGGIGVLRISGEDALNIAEKIYKSKGGKKPTQMAPYTAAFGHVYDHDEVVDECVLLVFRAPKSYTGEDVAELSCHGGVYVMRRVLQAALKAGARLAEPGEFTKRAFLNGKLDLTRAESVMDLISAQGSLAAKAAANQQEGALFKRISKMADTLVELSSDLSAWADFPDDEIPSLNHYEICKRLKSLSDKAGNFISGYEVGRVIREGVDTVIAGKPNVGKSTLMNLLSGAEKSIVTEIPGTTRDVVEESINMGGILLRLSDTAGLRETEDPVEIIGVERARKKLENADLIYAVFDAGCTLDEEDRHLIEFTKDKKAIAIINKTDLPNVINKEYIETNIQQKVYMSAASGQGIEELERITKELLGVDGIDLGAGVLANSRQLEAMRRAKDAIDDALKAAEDGMTLDAVSADIEEALQALLELTGERASDQVIARVFEKFCIGK